MSNNIGGKFELVPVLIDSKPIHSIFIRNRTKSQQPKIAFYNNFHFDRNNRSHNEQDDNFYNQHQDIIMEEDDNFQQQQQQQQEQQQHHPTNIQSMLKISRMNLLEKHHLM